LVTGRIALLLYLEASNVFAHHVRWAGTFARGGKPTVRNALMRRCITMGWHYVYLKSASFHGGI